MADATGAGAVYHYQATGGAATVVTYAAFRKLLAMEGDDVDEALQALVPDTGAIYGAFGRLWVTVASPAFAPPASVAGVPVGVTAIVTRGVVPDSVTTVSVHSQGKQTAAKTRNGKG